MSYNRPGVQEYGYATEAMFNLILDKANWGAAPLASKKQLLRIMQEINPDRLHRALTGIEANGGDIKDKDARGIMDTVYGIDFLIEYPGEDGIVVIAIDVTSDIGKVEEKAEKLLRLKPALKAGLNADMTLVVYMNPKRKPFGAMTNDEQWVVIGHLIDRIEAIIAKDKWCGTVTL